MYVKEVSSGASYGEYRTPEMGLEIGIEHREVGKVNATTTRTVLRAEGFSCPSCVDKIEKRVGRLDGVESVKVYFASARIEVVHDAGKVSVGDLVAAVAKAGYEAAPSAF
ncbi:heavy-metal-associated domain-containing protein [Actinomadura sp. BRA 177]|uniref:heavy-metal-associated domain-containing protein n=1 Tax=Actinomadura sp. BRA 177 TaxID=2745202 RepID=UPI0020CE8FEB|nr:heavy-metal-associated domain-containing protein [Actinomadura sp. BRA 177]